MNDAATLVGLLADGEESGKLMGLPWFQIDGLYVSVKTARNGGGQSVPDAHAHVLEMREAVDPDAVTLLVVPHIQLDPAIRSILNHRLDQVIVAISEDTLATMAKQRGNLEAYIFVARRAAARAMDERDDNPVRAVANAVHTFGLD